MAFQSYCDTQTSQVSSQQYMNDKSNNHVSNNRNNLDRINTTSMLFNMQSSRRVQVPSNKILSNQLNHKDYWKLIELIEKYNSKIDWRLEQYWKFFN